MTHCCALSSHYSSNDKTSTFETADISNLHSLYAQCRAMWMHAAVTWWACLVLVMWLTLINESAVPALAMLPCTRDMTEIFVYMTLCIGDWYNEWPDFGKSTTLSHLTH